MGYYKEVEMIALAHEMDLFTMAYAFTPDESRDMAKAGCDVLLAHVGLTSGGAIGAKNTLTLQQASDLTKAMAEAAWAVNRDMLVLTHGGPIATPQDVRAVLGQVPIHGFVGASSMERLPVEQGIRETTAMFASIPLTGD
jgi:predicted TIM-barrel enzyme